MTKYSHKENVVVAAAKFKIQIQQITENFVEEQFQDICGAEVIYEGEPDEEEKEIHIEDFEQTPPKMENNKPQIHDPMEEVNLSIVKEPRITYISSLLPIDLKK